jgi:hypothetical protein
VTLCKSGALPLVLSSFSFHGKRKRSKKKSGKGYQDKGAKSKIPGTPLHSSAGGKAIATRGWNAFRRSTLFALWFFCKNWDNVYYAISSVGLQAVAPGQYRLA